MHCEMGSGGTSTTELDFAPRSPRTFAALEEGRAVGLEAATAAGAAAGAGAVLGGTISVVHNGHAYRRGRSTRERQRQTLPATRPLPAFGAERLVQRKSSFEMQRTRRGCRHWQSPMSPQPLRRRSSRPVSRSTTMLRVTSRSERPLSGSAITGAVPWRGFTRARRRVRSSVPWAPLSVPSPATYLPVRCTNCVAQSEGMRAWRGKLWSG